MNTMSWILKVIDITMAVQPTPPPPLPRKRNNRAEKKHVVVATKLIEIWIALQLQFAHDILPSRWRGSRTMARFIEIRKILWIFWKIKQMICIFPGSRTNMHTIHTNLLIIDYQRRLQRRLVYWILGFKVESATKSHWVFFSSHFLKNIYVIAPANSP